MERAFSKHVLCLKMGLYKRRYNENEKVISNTAIARLRTTSHQHFCEKNAVVLVALLLYVKIPYKLLCHAE